MGAVKIPNVLTAKEQLRVLDVFNTRYFYPQRNKMIIRIMLDAGLRLSEVINLTWNNVDMENASIKIISGKNNKDRILWINDKALGELKEWKLRQEKKLEKKSEMVFTTRTGGMLSPSNLRKMVYNYTDKAGITYKQVSPHTFRHTFATDLYRKTKDLRLVQKALGHANLSTTQIYTHIVDDELEKAMKEFRN